MEGINNSRVSPEQADTSCRLILEQITNYRWYQLTSARRVTARLLRHPSRWFDTLDSLLKLDCALDGQFPLLGQTWGSFCLCRHANWADLLSLRGWTVWSVTTTFIITERRNKAVLMVWRPCWYCFLLFFMQMTLSVYSCLLSSYCLKELFAFRLFCICYWPQ